MPERLVFVRPNADARRVASAEGDCGTAPAPLSQQTGDADHEEQDLPSGDGALSARIKETGLRSAKNSLLINTLDDRKILRAGAQEAQQGDGSHQ
jgi:hypothetical protein